MTRKVILGFGISLDGYIARRNGDVDFLVIDKEGESLMADFFSKIDTTIMGRKTAAAWVKLRESGELRSEDRRVLFRSVDFLVIDKEGESLMADFFSKIDTTIMGRKTAAAWVKLRESGELPETPGMANYVVSRRWKPGKREGFEVVNGSLTALVRRLKRRPGKDIYLGGGGELARSFLQEDLVDELFIGVSPILLGDGIPGFPGKFPQRASTV